MYIVDPLNKREILVRSRRGREVVKSYLRVILGGGGGIPKIIHQIYFDLGGGKLENNEIFRKSSEKFRSIRGYKYKLWDRESCERLIRDFGERIYNFYEGLRYDIQRLDFARLCILYKYGGIYFDLDMIPLRRSLRKLVEGRKYVFHNIRGIKPNYSYIENDIMGSVKGDNFWLELIEYCMSEYRRKEKMEIYEVWKGRFVLQTTGPKLISRFVRRYYPEIKPLRDVVYTKWNKDSRKKYIIMDLKLNTWVGKGGGWI